MKKNPENCMVSDICGFFFLFSTTETSHTDAATSWLIVCMWTFEIQIAADHISLLDTWEKNKVGSGIKTNIWHF